MQPKMFFHRLKQRVKEGECNYQKKEFVFSELDNNWEDNFVKQSGEKCQPSVNFINVLCVTFMLIDPERVKNYS